MVNFKLDEWARVCESVASFESYLSCSDTQYNNTFPKASHINVIVLQKFHPYPQTCCGDWLNFDQILAEQNFGKLLAYLCKIVHKLVYNIRLCVGACKGKVSVINKETPD